MRPKLCPPHQPSPPASPCPSVTHLRWQPQPSGGVSLPCRSSPPPWYCPCYIPPPPPRPHSGVEAACTLSCAHCPTDSRPLLVAQASGDIHLALSQGQLREAEWGVHGMADLVSPAPHLDPDLR